MAEEKIIKNLDKESKEVFVNPEKIQSETENQESLAQHELAGDSDAHKKIREELENMDLDDGQKLQAQSHANDLQSLESQKKIEKLLQTARTKGVVFAVHAAKKLNDPYILDIFHDALAKEGYYREFKI